MGDTTQSHPTAIADRQDNFTDIAAAIARTLAQEPSCLNGQLRPEEEIADNLGVRLREVRAGLRQLARQGFLVRKRGSGTFVRRLPPKPIDSSTGQAPTISPDMLMRDPTMTKEPRGSKLRRMPREARWLQLGLWSDLYSQAHPTMELLKGMARRVESLGHNVTLRSLTSAQGVVSPVEELTERIKRQPCDGYIVIKYWAGEFEKAVDDNACVVWYQMHSTAMDREPMVTFNTREATQRAIGILADRGYQRIGLLRRRDVHGTTPPHSDDEQAYHSVLDGRGLPYRATQEDSIFTNEASLAAAQELLNRPEPPEAVYVADDHLLPALVEAARRRQRTIGSDLAVITLSNRGVPLPPGYRWSRMEFDPCLLGETLVDVLVQRILGEEESIPVQSYHARWKPGNTH